MSTPDFLVWLMTKLSLVAGLCLAIYGLGMGYLHARLWWRRRQMRPFLHGDRIPITRERRQMLARDGEL